MTPLRTRLRERTRAAHDRVDAAFGVHDLSRRPGYVAFLRLHARALLPVEAALGRAGVEDILPDWPARRRTAALRSDLARLGHGLPPPGESLDLRGPAEMLGALYVVEGSRLGARMLARRADASDDAGVRGATAYLRHGAGLPLWPTFVARLEDSPHGREAPDRVVDGALRTFALFAAAGDAAAKDDAHG